MFFFVAGSIVNFAVSPPTLHVCRTYTRPETLALLHKSVFLLFCHPTVAENVSNETFLLATVHKGDLVAVVIPCA